MQLQNEAGFAGMNKALESCQQQVEQLEEELGSLEQSASAPSAHKESSLTDVNRKVFGGGWQESSMNLAADLVRIV